MSNRKLHNHAFIFDLDGTLVDLRQIWEQTYTHLYQQQYGFTLTPDEMKSMFGPPELQCHTNILQGRGLYWEQRAQELVGETEKVMLLTLARTDTPRHIIPGAIPCLLELQRERAALAVATGNIESIARGILRHSGLQEYFPVVSFSCAQTPKRYQIVEQSLSRMEDFWRVTYDRSIVYVVGDTPSDVAAALEVGAVPVAVTTGSYTEESLRAAGASIVLPDLRGLPGLLLGNGNI